MVASPPAATEPEAGAAVKLAPATVVLKVSAAEPVFVSVTVLVEAAAPQLTFMKSTEVADTEPVGVPVPPPRSTARTAAATAACSGVRSAHWTAASAQTRREPRLRRQ